MGQEAEHNGEKNEYVCQHGSPRTKFYSGRSWGWRQGRVGCTVDLLSITMRSVPRSEVRSQKSEVKSQKSKVKSQKSEVRSQIPHSNVAKCATLEWGTQRDVWVGTRFSSVGLGDYFGTFFGFVDVAYYFQILVDSHGSGQGAAAGAAAGDGDSSEAEVLEKDGVSLFWGRRGFSLGDGIFCPVEEDASGVGFFCGQCDRSFFRLVANFQFILGIDFGGEGIDRHEREEYGRFYNAVPVEGIDPLGISRGANGIGSVVVAGFEGADGAAMFVVAQSPQEDDSDESDGGSDASAWATESGADFFVDQAEEGWNN